MSTLRTRLRFIHLLHVSHLRYYRANVWIDSHHTLSKISCQIKLSVGRFMFGPLTHITLIIRLLKFLDNLWNILQTDISNGIPWIFVLLWSSIGLGTHIVNQSLYILVLEMWFSSCPYYQNPKICPKWCTSYHTLSPCVSQHCDDHNFSCSPVWTFNLRTSS